MSFKPKLYSYFRSSASWRVRTALAYKGIDYEYVPVNILAGDQHHDEFKEINKLSQVPAFIVNGKTLTQSMAILEYLEEVHPDKPLLPQDPIKRAQARAIAEMVNSGIQPIQNMGVMNELVQWVDKSREDVKGDWARLWINRGFVALERTLEETAGKFCVGDDLSFADLCLVPQVYNANRFKIDMKQYPIITRINETCSALPAFKSAHPSNQQDCPEDLK